MERKFIRSIMSNRDIARYYLYEYRCCKNEIINNMKRGNYLTLFHVTFENHSCRNWNISEVCAFIIVKLKSIKSNNNPSKKLIKRVRYQDPNILIIETNNDVYENSRNSQIASSILNKHYDQ